MVTDAEWAERLQDARRSTDAQRARRRASALGKAPPPSTGGKTWCGRCGAYTVREHVHRNGAR